ncbi:hypothetical protein NBRC116188_04470 [Oceaniserpentilla sp. 4NH20-0058]|uniref:hypothetical protein n=1 Tax=Oceaniserpentilla sp. 4NH20-0058 TaxID=3127660 RepID=UPI00310521E1
MRGLIFLLCLFLSISVQAKTESQTIEQVFRLSPVIYDVKGMGNWKTAKHSGQIRLVITRSDKQDEMFLQWVQWNEKGPELIKSTVAIKEIQQAGRFKVMFIRRESTNGQRKIILGLENLHDKLSTRAIIHVDGIGRYRCVLE